MTRNKIITLLLALATLIPCLELRAQEEREIITSAAGSADYNPITAMLDSLITLNHVIRYNQLDANCYDPKSIVPGSVPSFSDKVYTDRIGAIHSPIPLSYNRYVKEFIDLYAVRKRGLTQRAMGLSNLYFPLFEEVLDREGLPLEFKYLSIVESALNPIAVSRVGATGIWQFMYNTGLIYNLKVNSYTDERRDPVKATFAACQYFKDMYAIYNDWLLVIAAYNCGAGNVNKAIRRSGGKTNFWEIMQYLPAETRGYVPAFIAVAYVMHYSREHNLYPVSPAYSYFEVDTVVVNRPLNFDVLSRTIDLPKDVISYLNPVYKRGIIPDIGDNYVLRLPTRKMSQFLAAQEQIFATSTPPARPVYTGYTSRREDETADDGNAVRYEITSKRVKKTHTVRRGENLSSIADKYDMTTAEIKKMNRLRSTRLQAGQRISVMAWSKTKVPVKQQSEPRNTDAVASDTGKVNANDLSAASPASGDSAEAADRKSPEVASAELSAPNPRFIYHVVQPGDTLWNIAKRYEGVTVEMIKDINNLRNSQLKPGTRLKVIVNG